MKIYGNWFFLGFWIGFLLLKLYEYIQDRKVRKLLAKEHIFFDDFLKNRVCHINCNACLDEYGLLEK